MRKFLAMTTALVMATAALACDGKKEPLTPDNPTADPLMMDAGGAMPDPAVAPPGAAPPAPSSAPQTK